MSRFELPPQYDPHAVERPLYRRWLERGVFTARAESPKPPYVIVIPPPNVTAVVPMGQGVNRSEEGRVGEEGKIRGSADHLKKKKIKIGKEGKQILEETVKRLLRTMAVVE